MRQVAEGMINDRERAIYILVCAGPRKYYHSSILTWSTPENITFPLAMPTELVATHQLPLATFKQKPNRLHDTLCSIATKR